jgi:hypothetical protein
MIRAKCGIIIAGNHELHAARKTPGITPLFSYPEDWYQKDFPTKWKLSEDKVWLYDSDELDALYSHEDKAFVNSLPEFGIENGVLFTHYLYPNLTGSARQFYYAIEEFREHQSFATDRGCRISFSGHQHPPGLLVAAGNHIFGKRFNRNIRLTGASVVLIPPVVRSRGGSGFCIFDADQLTIEAKRI